MEIQTITRPSDRRAAAPIVLEGHPAIAALPAGDGGCLLGFWQSRHS